MARRNWSRRSSSRTTMSWKSIWKGKSRMSRPSSAASARAPSSWTFFPTYCGSSFKNKGVQLVLDAVVDYLPNPTEVKPQPEVDLEGNDRRIRHRGRGQTLARTGVQNHGRPVWRIDLPSHLFGTSGEGHTRAQHLHRQDRTDWPHRGNARQLPRRKSIPPKPATSSPCSA